MSYRIIDTLQDFTDRETGVRSMMCEIIADTAADLPANTAQRIFIIGSFATVIDTGDEYKINSGGTWILQPSGDIFQNVYTKSEIDSIVSGIGAEDTKQNYAIIDLINSGGKNLCPVNDNTATLRMIIDIDIPAGDYMLYIGELISTDTDTSVCLITLYDGGGNTLYTGGSTRGTDKQIPLELTDTAKKLYIYASDNYSHSSGDTVTITNLMICNKSYWDMTEQYTEYCPTVSQLYDMFISEISGLNNLIGAGI